jgi:hypothetical protein
MNYGSLPNIIGARNLCFLSLWERTEVRALLASECFTLALPSPQAGEGKTKPI